MKTMIGTCPRPTTSRGALAVCLAAAWGSGCWQASQHHDCEPGELLACTTECGEGFRTCGEEGSYGECDLAEAPECEQWEAGSCLLDDGETGRWSCTSRCERGPCEPGCASGERRDCEGECGLGRVVCNPAEVWGVCEEWVVPTCRPGEIERCFPESGHRTCRPDCTFSDCREIPCAPGDVATCVVERCGEEVCLEDGRWSGCDLSGCLSDGSSSRPDCGPNCGPYDEPPMPY